jgi:transposase-like protein
MEKEINKLKTLIQAVEFFADPDNAHTLMVQLRWPGAEVCCPTCGSLRIRYIQTRRQWECREQHSKRRFSLKTGTIMEESPLPLKKWLAAIWMEVNCKNSISSYEIARDLGITQKSAWFMLHRIRFAIKQRSFEKIGGKGEIIEADETFVGGLAKNMHKDRRARAIKGTGRSNSKTTVMGLLARSTEDSASFIRAMIVPNAQRVTVHDVIHKNVEPGSQVFTDAWWPYRQMDPKFFHDFVDHAEAYVKGAVHTNGLENFWSLLKRCIRGTHINVEPFHLLAYVDSEAFRFNHRKMNDGGRFSVAMPNMIGKRLTYKALIGASEVAPASDKGAGDAGIVN